MGYRGQVSHPPTRSLQEFQRDQPSECSLLCARFLDVKEMVDDDVVALMYEFEVQRDVRTPPFVPTTCPPLGGRPALARGACWLRAAEALRAGLRGAPIPCPSFVISTARCTRRSQLGLEHPEGLNS